MSTQLLIGIDGGGSKTSALLADSAGRVLGRGLAGASNYQAIGLERAGAALEQAVRAAFDDARIAPIPPLAVCLGLAGAGRAADMELFRAWAAAQWPGARIVVVSDAELVLAAGTPGGWGLALICGTGSIAYGRDRDGRVARAGGWGYLLGDEGSGYAIGLAALRAVARAADGRGPFTALADALLARWSLAAPADLIRRVYRERAATSEIAALATLVDETAASGDTVAREILREAGRELALALGAVAGRLEWRGPAPCALAGGLIVHSRTLAGAMREAASELRLVLDPVTNVTEPAIGAIQIAARLYRDKVAS
jgi:N-acetylglucosamine kinase-like BadF-type ATPase